MQATSSPSTSTTRSVSSSPGSTGPPGSPRWPTARVLVAESGTNRVLGYGGRYADGSEVAKDLPSPQALTTGSDGTPYVTLGDGQVGKLDLSQPAGQRYQKVTDGLRGAARPRRAAAGPSTSPRAAAGVVTQVAMTGEKTQAAAGFQQPVGVATGPGRTLFVADQRAGKIMQGRRRRQGSASSPSSTRPHQLPSIPSSPVPTRPTRSRVATKGSVQRFDRDRKRIYTSPDVKAGVGVAAVPSSEAGGLEGPRHAHHPRPCRWPVAGRVRLRVRHRPRPPTP